MCWARALKSFYVNKKKYLCKKIKGKIQIMSSKLEVKFPFRFPPMLHAISLHWLYLSSIFWPDCLRQLNTIRMMRRGIMGKIYTQVLNSTLFSLCCICSCVSSAFYQPEQGRHLYHTATQKAFTFLIMLCRGAVSPRCRRVLMQWCCTEQRKAARSHAAEK